mmetsp:Transcript_1497/g.2612  ORF Transcript_1497/g.2612 Transcript_1497/m.2612 type:complete len:570 (-) Transcript_1497:162-1871(-)
MSNTTSPLADARNPGEAPFEEMYSNGKTPSKANGNHIKSTSAQDFMNFIQRTKATKGTNQDISQVDLASPEMQAKFAKDLPELVGAKERQKELEAQLEDMLNQLKAERSAHQKTKDTLKAQEATIMNLRMQLLRQETEFEEKLRQEAPAAAVNTNILTQKPPDPTQQLDFDALVAVSIEALSTQDQQAGKAADAPNAPAQAPKRKRTKAQQGAATKERATKRTNTKQDKAKNAADTNGTASGNGANAKANNNSSAKANTPAATTTVTNKPAGTANKPAGTASKAAAKNKKAKAAPPAQNATTSNPAPAPAAAPASTKPQMNTTNQSAPVQPSSTTTQGTSKAAPKAAAAAPNKSPETKNQENKGKSANKTTAAAKATAAKPKAKAKPNKKPQQDIVKAESTTTNNNSSNNNSSNSSSSNGSPQGAMPVKPAQMNSMTLQQQQQQLQQQQRSMEDESSSAAMHSGMDKGFELTPDEAMIRDHLFQQIQEAQMQKSAAQQNFSIYQNLLLNEAGRTDDLELRHNIVAQAQKIPPAIMQQLQTAQNNEDNAREQLIALHQWLERKYQQQQQQ